MRIHIRRATPADVDWLMGQLTHFSRFFGSSRELIGNQEYSRVFLLSLIEKHFVLISDSEAGPTGLVAGIITPHLFNPEIRVLAEAFWWVDEKFRGTRSGLMLLEEFTEWGKKNVDWMTFALEENSPVTDRCLLKRGFKLKERSYLLEVNACQP